MKVRMRSSRYNPGMREAGARLGEKNHWQAEAHLDGALEKALKQRNTFWLRSKRDGVEIARLGPMLDIHHEPDFI